MQTSTASSAEHDQLDLIKILEEKLTDALRERGRVNILIAGKTGVGKSTLINAVFQGDLATTGQGKPVTQNTREIKKDGIPVSIFDTRGLEIEKFEETFSAVTSFVDTRAASADPNEHIHCAWICITEDSRRVEDGEIRLCQALAKKMPVIAVITKARSDNNFRTIVQEILPDAANVVRVRAIHETLDGGVTLPPVGLEDLVNLTMEVVPEGHKNAFVAAQKVVLRQKQEKSQRIVAAATASAAAIGATPIPFADAVLLVPIQIGMLASISATFGLPLSTAFLSTLVSATLAGAAGTIVGRTLVGGILLLLPDAGLILKGVISGSTGALLTTAFGSAYIATLSFFCSQDPDHPPTAEQIAERLKLEMAKRNPFA